MGPPPHRRHVPRPRGPAPPGQRFGHGAHVGTAGWSSCYPVVCPLFAGATAAQPADAHSANWHARSACSLAVGLGGFLEHAVILCSTELNGAALPPPGNFRPGPGRQSRAARLGHTEGKWVGQTTRQSQFERGLIRSSYPCFAGGFQFSLLNLLELVLALF